MGGGGGGLEMNVWYGVDGKSAPGLKSHPKEKTHLPLLKKK